MDPISIALSLAGLGLNFFGAKSKADEERDNATRQIQARNQATADAINVGKHYQKDASGTLAGVVDSFNPLAIKRGTNSARALAGRQLNNSAPTDEQIGSILLGPGTSRSVTARHDARAKLGQTGNENTREANRRGNLLGWGNSFNPIADRLETSGQKLDQISNFARTEGSFTPLLQTIASNNAIKPSSGVGDIFNFLGALTASKVGSPFETLFARSPTTSNSNFMY